MRLGRTQTSRGSVQVTLIISKNLIIAFCLAQNSSAAILFSITVVPGQLSQGQSPYQ